MGNLQENIVPATNQNRTNYFHEEGRGIRVLFVGNSITRHGPRADIGWDSDWGMAASSIENDYLHRLVAKIRGFDPDMAWSIAQVAPFEWDFANVDPAESYPEAVAFEADIIIMFFGANVPKTYDTDPAPQMKFGDAYEKMRNAFVGGREDVFVCHGQGFYIRPVLDEEKRAVARRCGDAFVELGDIQTRPETHGRYNHPNDRGMEEIAAAFWQVLEPAVKRKTGK